MALTNILLFIEAFAIPVFPTIAIDVFDGDWNKLNYIYLGNSTLAVIGLVILLFWMRLYDFANNTDDKSYEELIEEDSNIRPVNKYTEELFRGERRFLSF